MTMIKLLNEIFNKIKENRILYIILRILRHVLYLHVINRQKYQLLASFFMIMHEDSNKLYPSMVTHHQMILECSIIVNLIIHSFEIDTS